MATTEIKGSSKNRPKVVVMTGGTAGIGKHALKLIASSSSGVIIGSRYTKAEQGETLELDLSSLSSVREFADEVSESLGSAQIDVLILNAGIGNLDTKLQSTDGYEAIFAVNHLSHYLLARLLLPKMANLSKLIITTSDVHAQAPTPMNIDEWSRVHENGSGMKAYAASKLCNLLTARGLLIEDAVTEKQCQIIAFNPGLTVGTSLSRNFPKWQRLLMNNAFVHMLMGLVSYFVPMMYPGSPQRAGEALADLALGKECLAEGAIYASLVRSELTYPEPSELAMDNAARDLLWKRSAEMVNWLD